MSKVEKRDTTLHHEQASGGEPTLVSGWLSPQRLRATTPHQHLLMPRIVAGVPLLGIGLAHAVDPEVPMGPLVEAAGLPFAAVLSPVAVALEIIAGLSLLLGLWARLGGFLAIPTMLGAIYAHLVIDLWPNGAENEPPLALPIAVTVAAAYVLWRGAGRWSLDQRHRRDTHRSTSRWEAARPLGAREQPQTSKTGDPVPSHRREPT